jgi:hypothetical protein
LVPPDLAARIVAVSEASSHDPSAVATILGELTDPTSRVTLLPNTGDVPWAAAMTFVNRMALQQRSNVRVLGVVHSDTETQYALAVRYAPIAPVWIGVSQRCAATLRSRLPAPDTNVHVLPCPIESRERRARRAPVPGPLRLAYVGRLEEPQKRVSRLLDLFRELTRSGVDFQATVAGDGPAAPEFAARLRAADRQTRARVTLCGAVSRDEVDAIWNTHDVCLLVSAYEGLPIALLEAMAAGACPVVMAVESGLPDLLADRRNARVVRQGDVGAMAEAIGDLGRNRALVADLGDAARLSITASYSPGSHFERLERIIDECWARPQPEATAAIVDSTATAIAEAVARLRAIGRPVAVYGAGMVGRRVVDACLADGIPVCALFDSDPARTGAAYRDLLCAAPHAVTNHPDAVFIAGSLQFADAMVERIHLEFAAAGHRAPTVLTAT